MLLEEQYFFLHSQQHYIHQPGNINFWMFIFYPYLETCFLGKWVEAPILKAVAKCSLVVVMSQKCTTTGPYLITFLIDLCHYFPNWLWWLFCQAHLHFPNFSFLSQNMFCNDFFSFKLQFSSGRRHINTFSPHPPPFLVRIPLYMPIYFKWIFRLFDLSSLLQNSVSFSSPSGLLPRVLLPKKWTQMSSNFHNFSSSTKRLPHATTTLSQKTTS